MTANKTIPTSQNVDEFLATFADVDGARQRKLIAHAAQQGYLSPRCTRQ